jgi:hypothetical protein
MVVKNDERHFTTRRAINGVKSPVLWLKIDKTGTVSASMSESVSAFDSDDDFFRTLTTTICAGMDQTIKFAYMKHV